MGIILYEKFSSEEGIFGYNIMPEDILPKWGSDLSTSNIARGSYEHLIFITLIVLIDYQRNADQLWEAGRKTFEDKSTRWLFTPRELMNKSLPEIKSAMMVHSLAKKPSKDARIWYTVSKSFFEMYDSDPINLIKECDYDALKIYNKKFDQRFKCKFPFLSGDKIFPLWIRMLHDNVGIELKNLCKIPIPVDTHIARASFTTGCLTGKYSGSISAVRHIIDGVWKGAVESSNHPRLEYRLQLDEPLWHLSRYGCKYRTDDFCPKKARYPVNRFCVKRYC
ncbi:MAG: hypothetical protein QXL46_04045 [Nitrososphaerales archaeon]